MFQVEIVVSGSGEIRPYGPKVATLEECTKLVKEMDAKWASVSAIEDDDELQKLVIEAGLTGYEGCDLYARHDDGRLFSLDNDVVVGPNPDDNYEVEKWEYVEPILANDGRDNVICTECNKFPCKHFGGVCADRATEISGS